MSEIEANTLEAMKRLVAFRDRQITDLHTALVTASQQNDLANRRILALEAELKLARQQVGNMEAQLLLVAEAEDKRDTGDEALYRAIRRI